MLITMRVYKNLPLVPALSQINSVYAMQTYFMKIHFDSNLASIPKRPSVHFPSGLSTKSCRYFSYQHTCYLHHAFHSPWFDHPSNILWRMRVMVLHSSNFIHPALTSSLLGPHIFLSILFSNIITIFSSIKL